MILSGTVTSPAVQGVTVQDPADQSAPSGFGVVANGMRWVATPGPNFAIATPATPASSGTSIFDWTQASYFIWTPYGGSCTVSFTNAAGVLTPSLGQMILVHVPHAGSASVTWPSTITWLTGSGGAAPALTAKDCVIAFVCTATGSAPTFDAWLVAQQS